MRFPYSNDKIQRHCDIGKDDSGFYYVSFTDWSTRQGGSKNKLTLTQAQYYAKAFCEGCRYIFDTQIGIVLVGV